MSGPVTPLRTNVAVNDIGHDAIHNEERVALNTLSAYTAQITPVHTAGLPVWDPLLNSGAGGYSSVIDPTTLARKVDIADAAVAWGDTSGQKQLDTSVGLSYDGRLVGNLVLTGITGSIGSLGIVLTLRQDSVGGHTVAFPKSWLWNGGVLQSMPLAPGADAAYLLMQSGSNIIVTQIAANSAAVNLLGTALSLFSGNVHHALEFDTVSGTVVTDYGPNQWNGTILGSPTLQTGPVVNSSDATDQSITFTGGSGEAVTLDNHPLVSLNTSWSLVLRGSLPSASTANGDSVFMQSSSSSTNAYFQFVRSPSASTGGAFTRPRIYWRCDNGGTAYVDQTATDSSTGRAFLGTGHIFVLVYEVTTAAISSTAGAATLKLYIDGQQDGATTNLTIPATGTSAGTFTTNWVTFGDFRRSGTTTQASSVGLKMSASIGVTRAITAAEVARIQTAGA